MTVELIFNIGTIVIPTFRNLLFNEYNLRREIARALIMTDSMNKPPKLFLRFFRWYCHPKLKNHIEGDLIELYRERIIDSSKLVADLKFMLDVMLLFRPGIIKPAGRYKNQNHYDMYKSYFIIGLRNLLRNKGYSFINIGGLALGMAVAIMIGLWIKDEMSFNKNFDNYDRIARVMQRATYNGETKAGAYLPFPLGPELNQMYHQDFKSIVRASFAEDHIISAGDVKFNQVGNYMEPGAPEMLTLKMLAGTRSGLEEMNSILLSESLSKTLFGDQGALNRTVRIDNKKDLIVTGVYQDLPRNSEFYDMTFIAPWDLYIASNDWLKRFLDSWPDGMIQIFVQVHDQAQMSHASAKIEKVIYNHTKDEDKIHNVQTFLHPMERWHLYEDFKNGYSATGQIQFVWLFGTIGVFVLLLACINFMNLSTARSERRAKEVGIRKAVGSLRSQVIGQFYSESLLVTMLAFSVSIAIVLVALPWFNEVSDKNMNMPWNDQWFWISCVAFTLATGLIAGSYPALYLSSFQAVKVLKGAFRAGRFASIPRKILVVTQFAVSITLIIGTIIVYQQIQFTKDRAVGYNREQMIYLQMKTNEIHDHFEAVKNELIKADAIVDMAESTSAATQNYQANFGGFEWKGKDPGFSDNFGVSWISPEYGSTVGWKVIAGRDVSRSIPSDAHGVMINESAAKYMALDNPVGEILKLEGQSYTIVGVVEDMLVGNPYAEMRRALYLPIAWTGGVISIRLSSTTSTQESLKKVQRVFQAYEPAMPFDYSFADEQYAKKFGDEVRLGTLASVFATLAIVISCLGLFGLASFVAEQRTKEIGIRKIVGASVFNLWSMLSKDFMVLVIVSSLISVPVAYYFLSDWLLQYHYHTTISSWIFVVTVAGALAITLLTVSYQAVRAAMMNPVKSLRSE